MWVKIFWAKMASMNCYSDMYASNISMEGRIWKKSEILGKWEPRLVRINEEGLKSYKNPNGKESLYVKSTGELWSRFDMLQGHSLVVVKIKHNALKI